jgi:hypothetical protein
MSSIAYQLHLKQHPDVTPSVFKALYKEEIEALERKEEYPIVQWKLCRDPNAYDNMHPGMTFFPRYMIDALTPLLNKDFVVEQLERGNCFDFAYEEQEEDVLELYVGWWFDHKGIAHKQTQDGEFNLYSIYLRGAWHHKGVAPEVDIAVLEQGVVSLTPKTVK